MVIGCITGIEIAIVIIIWYIFFNVSIYTLVDTGVK